MNMDTVPLAKLPEAAEGRSRLPPISWISRPKTLTWRKGGSSHVRGWTYPYTSLDILEDWGLDSNLSRH